MLDGKKFISTTTITQFPKEDPVHTNGTDKDLKIATTNKMSGCHIVLIMSRKYSSY
jgi:hypothetical protein